MEFIIHKPEELEKVAQFLLSFAGPARPDGKRKNILLEGDLGAGKTTLVKAVGKILGVEDAVSSPTYAIVHQYAYRDKNDEEQLLHHIDLYRLKDLHEALDIGIEEYLNAPYYCFIEWPEVIAPLLQEDAIRIKIKLLSDSSRKILFL